MKKEESQRGQSLLEAQVTLVFDVLESKLPVCVLWAAEDSSSPPASPGTGVTCSGTSATATGAGEVCQEGFDICFPVIWKEYNKIAADSQCLFSSLPPPLYNVFTLCNFSQLTDVQRKI